MIVVSENRFGAVTVFCLTGVELNRIAYILGYVLGYVLGYILGHILGHILGLRDIFQDIS